MERNLVNRLPQFDTSMTVVKMSEALKTQNLSTSMFECLIYGYSLVKVSADKVACFSTSAKRRYTKS